MQKEICNEQNKYINIGPSYLSVILYSKKPLLQIE